jgi:hypothetical protein
MRFYAPATDSSGAQTEDPGSPAGSGLADIAPVEGEKPVDFSKLIAPPEPEKAPEGAEPQETEKKVTTGQPEGKTGPKKEEPKAEEAAKGEKKPAEAKKEPAKAVRPEAQATEEPPADDKLPSIEEIEAMQIKPGAPEAKITQFGGLKAVTKRYAQLYKEASAELEAEKARKVALAEEQTKELEELRANRLIFEEETSPAVQEKIAAKFKEADDALFGLLKSPSLGMEEPLEKLTRKALENYTHESAKFIKENIFDKIADPIMLDRVKQAFVARFNAQDEQQKELSKLRGDKENWLKGRAEQEKKQTEEWTDKARSKASELVQKFPWMARKQIPEGATKEARAAAEAHNVKLDAKTKECQQLIADVYQRDPEKLTEVVFKHFHADYLDEQIKDLTTERDELKARVEELEALTADARDAGRQKTAGGSVETKADEPVSQGIGGDAETAIHKFFSKQPQSQR